MRGACGERSKLQTLDASVAAVLASWQPKRLDTRDAAAWLVVAVTVRSWVAAAAPATCRVARTLLWATARLAVWAHRMLGTVEASTVLHPHNVTHFVMYVHADESAGWRHCARSARQRVGRAVCPELWLPAAPPAGRPPAPVPYTALQERRFALAAVMPGRSHRVARMWLVAASLGAGLRGAEIALCGPGNVVPAPGGRAAVQVPGECPRLAAVRGAYTEMALHAVRDCAAPRFLAGAGRNAASSIAGRLGTGDGLSLRRARATWIAAHLTARTPLAALRAMAGPLGQRTLDGVLDHVADAMTPEDAVAVGLEA